MKDYNLNELETDLKCTRCGKHVDQLIKVFRELDLVDYNEECEKIISDISSGKRIEDLNEIYGTNKVQSAILYESLVGNLETSLECRDCIQEDGPFKHYLDHKRD